jgi:hypothetical protein
VFCILFDPELGKGPWEAVQKTPSRYLDDCWNQEDRIFHNFILKRNGSLSDFNRKEVLHPPEAQSEVLAFL